MKAEKEYACAYKYCLHHGQKIKSSESVVINKKRYHWDCAAMKQEIKECADTYMTYIEDQTQYPIVTRIINTLVFKDNIPIDFILKNVQSGKKYYEDKSVYILYGLRKLFWEKEYKA